MADHCGICDTRRPEGGTKMLVLNNGALWLEFCKNCESEKIQNAVTGETTTLGALFNQSSDSNTPKGDLLPLDAFHDSNEDDDYDREEENRINRSWEDFENAQAEAERLDAPTWYEMLGEFILGRKERKLYNLRA